jgi:protein TonB
MPSTLFDQTFAQRPKNRRPFGTVTISIALHAAALATYATLQLTTGLGGPPVIARLRAFVAEPDLPKPPPAAATPVHTTPSPNINPNAAPAVQPEKIEPEAPTLAVTATDAVPGAFLSGGGPTISAPPPQVSAPAADTAARPSGPQRVGGDIRPPERVTYVAPNYPDIARTAHVEGKVVLEATIDEWGVVKNVTVRQSVPLLDKAAIEAVSKWRYAPTRLNGQPIAIVMMVTVTFTLR